MRAGADPATVRIVDVEEVPLGCLAGAKFRVRIKAVGDLALAARAPPPPAQGSAA